MDGGAEALVSGAGIVAQGWLAKQIIDLYSMTRQHSIRQE
jgi:hypothetical protein